MGTRITLRGLVQAVIVARLADANVAITTEANAVAGNKSLKFYGAVKVGAADYDLANSNGKLKLFANADDLVKYMAQAVPVGSGSYVLKINTGAILAAAVPTDLIKAAAAKIVKLNATKLAQQAVLADIDAQLALMAGWENGSVLQVNKLNETNIQRAAVVADMAAIDAEIVRLS